jgi:pimeloyl-ACP methyl ester carboxylesterase
VPKISLASPDGIDVVEEVVRFGEDDALFGVLTTPTNGAHPGSPALLLVNTGGNHRVGVNRDYVSWARALAADGFLVLRMDVRGMGDSPPAVPGELSVLYRPGARDDIRAAISWLEDSRGARGAVCIGLCAGAYHAFHVAVADSRVVGLVLLDPLRFRLADDFAGARPIRSDVHRRRGIDYVEALVPWRRTPSHPSSAEALEVAVRTVRAWLLDKAAAAPRLAGVLPPTWLSRSIRAMTDRGCLVHVVITSDSGIDRYLVQELAPIRHSLECEDRFIVDVVRGSDHILSPLWSQEWLGARLREVLHRRFVG